MRILLDTHCLLWWLGDPEQFNKKAFALFLDPRQDLVISSVVSWEISIKTSLGRLRLPKPYKTILGELFEGSQFSSLSIEHAHAMTAGGLPSHHADPFDRLLIAQSITEKLPILTADRLFKKYPVELVWACR